MSRENGLCWTGRVLSADDLRRNLNGQDEILLSPGTIITPLAADHIRMHGLSVSIRPEAAAESAEAGSFWGYSEETPHPLVTSALQAVKRDGIRLEALPATTDNRPGGWARSVAECIAAGRCRGGLVFCSDAGLACCVANKVKGVRAVAVSNARQAARALGVLGANLLAVEMPGPTFFEIRQIARCLAKPSSCPDGVACVLEELEGHAHR
jgi:hypothetical protein